jgi:hypothetical protein
VLCLRLILFHCLHFGRRAVPLPVTCGFWNVVCNAIIFLNPVAVGHDVHPEMEGAIREVLLKGKAPYS